MNSKDELASAEERMIRALESLAEEVRVLRQVVAESLPEYVQRAAAALDPAFSELTAPLMYEAWERGEDPADYRVKVCRTPPRLTAVETVFLNGLLREHAPGKGPIESFSVEEVLIALSKSEHQLSPEGKKLCQEITRKYIARLAKL